jgi:hypothetical protein
VQGFDDVETNATTASHAGSDGSIVETSEDGE